MDRNLLVLAALSPARGVPHTPVQVQKLLFLIDKNIPHEVEGPHFNFQPYDYGPFDQAVYSVLDELAGSGHIAINEQPGRRWKTYALTAEGQAIGHDVLSRLDKRAQAYISKLSEFVLSLNFAQLISAVYKAYPEMKINSVFRE